MTVNRQMIRKDFPALHQALQGHPLVHLDNAATNQKPSAVIEALVRFDEGDNANAYRDLHELSDRAATAFEAGRDRVVKFIDPPLPKKLPSRAALPKSSISSPPGAAAPVSSPATSFALPRWSLGLSPVREILRFFRRLSRTRPST